MISIVDLPASITPLLRPGNSLIATREGKDMSNRYVIPFLRDDEVDRLDAAENALLAPVRSEGGEDRRRKLPREYFEKKPSRFLTKFLFALGMIALSWVVIAANLHWSATMLAIAVAGLMYAHLVELQHECLHEHAFRLPGVARPLDAKKIRSEYRLIALALVAAVAYTVLTGEPFLLFAWLLPTLLVAEATHYLIEMPEHFGLNSQSDPNVLTNTRTIKASKFAQWFTNYNNLHTAHHYHQGVPIAQVEVLHALIADKIVPTETSYLSFYRKVLSGDVKYHTLDETCMTR